MMPIHYDTLPEHDRESMRLYVEHGILPGGFLTACLENNLSEAMVRADKINRECLLDIVSFLYNEIPSPAWGSPEKVRQWSMDHQAKRLAKDFHVPR